MKSKQHLYLVPDYPARIALENQRLAEKREDARRDLAKIIVLWSHHLWQEKHVEPPKEIA